MPPLGTGKAPGTAIRVSRPEGGKPVEYFFILSPYGRRNGARQVNSEEIEVSEWMRSMASANTGATGRYLILPQGFWSAG